MPEMLGRKDECREIEMTKKPFTQAGPLWSGDCNCTYTTTANADIKMSIDALMALIEEIPERPKIFRMNINVISNDILPKNYIMLSKDVADALEEAMKRKSGASVK